VSGVMLYYTLLFQFAFPFAPILLCNSNFANHHAMELTEIVKFIYCSKLMGKSLLYPIIPEINFFPNSESKPKPDVTVCVSMSSFVQVIVSSTLILIGLGENALLPNMQHLGLVFY
jgi:hypothetical protein